MYNEIEGRAASAEVKPRKEHTMSHAPEPMPWEPQAQSQGKGGNWKTMAVFGVSALAMGLSVIALAVSASAGSGTTAASNAKKVQPTPHHQTYQNKHHFNPHQINHHQMMRDWQARMPEHVKQLQKKQEVSVSRLSQHVTAQNPGTDVGQNAQETHGSVVVMRR